MTRWHFVTSARRSLSVGSPWPRLRASLRQPHARDDRYRLYAPLGLRTVDIAEITAFVNITFMIGLAIMFQVIALLHASALAGIGLPEDTSIAFGAGALALLKPLGIDAAVKALMVQTSEISAAQRQLELALQEAHFSAAYARRQYDAVDPANRLVAGGWRARAPLTLRRTLYAASSNATATKGGTYQAISKTNSRRIEWTSSSPPETSATTTDSGAAALSSRTVTPE
jgi:hypothetical protein